MGDVTSLSNESLRDELKEYGVVVGPLVGTTRNIYEKKLVKLRKEGKKAPAAKPTPVLVKSKSPTRLAKKPTASTSPSRVRAPPVSVDTEESQEDSDQEHPLPSSRSSKPLTSSPIREKKVPAPVSQPPSASRTSYSPGRTTKSTTETSIFSSTRGSDHSDIRSYSTTTPYIAKARPDESSYSSSSAKRTPQKSPSRLPTFDRPGGTPPRTAASSRRVTTSVYSSPANQSYSSVRSPGVFSASRTIGDLGHTTGEEDEGGDEGEETTRYVYSQSRSGAKNTRGGNEVSPLRKLWNRATGSDQAQFKVGDKPATSYELRMDGTRTRFQRDPRTGRVTLDQEKQKAGWLDDLPRLLIIVMSIFFALLAAAYVATARKEALTQTARVVSGAARDSIHFFYTYLILPTIILGIGAAIVIVVYFVHRRWAAMKEKEDNDLAELVEKITDMIRDACADGEEYVSVPHIRDVLFPPAKRRSEELTRWEKAVQHINENESRVGTECHLIRGHECLVWKWLQPQRVGWQGKAFGSERSTLTATRNSSVPAAALSCCLKIRDMFLPVSSEGIVVRDMKEKIAPVKPLHVTTETIANEGIVFAMFKNRKDALSAFLSLHGEWYNGRLLNVKYILERKYFERYPHTAELLDEREYK